MSASLHGGSGRPARARTGRVALGVILAVALIFVLPAIAAGKSPERSGAVASARVTVAQPVTSSGFQPAVAADNRSVYTVSPTVAVDGRDGGRVVSNGTVVRASGNEGKATGGVRRQLEAFSYTDLGDGRILIDPAWVARNIVTADVPVLGQTRCHRAVFAPLVGALTQIAEAGLDHLLDPADYGGCWVPRRIDWSPHRPLSMHAWGLAFDVNVATNGLGAEPTLDPRIVEVFERWGFAWGGHWLRPDGMHFELARIQPGGA